MSDAWGGAWGGAWGDSWGAVDTAAPPAPDLSISLATGSRQDRAPRLRLARDPRVQRNNELILAVVIAAITSGALP